MQAFRRAKNEEPTKAFRLVGLDRTATYELTNLDVAGSKKVKGRELMEQGVVIEIAGKPAAALVKYHKI